MKSEPHDKEECPDWVLAWESEYTEEELLAQARESYVEWRVSRSILIASALIVLFSFFLFTTHHFVCHIFFAQENHLSFCFYYTCFQRILQQYSKFSS